MNICLCVPSCVCSCLSFLELHPLLLHRICMKGFHFMRLRKKMSNGAANRIRLTKNEVDRRCLEILVSSAAPRRCFGSRWRYDTLRNLMLYVTTNRYCIMNRLGVVKHSSELFRGGKEASIKIVDFRSLFHATN